VSDQGRTPSRNGLALHGLSTDADAYWNLTAAELYEHAVRRGEGRIAADGALVTETGEHTGRSPNDRFVVEDSVSRDAVWWGSVNRPISQEHFDALLAKIRAHMNGRDLFVQDAYAGADPEHRLAVRVVTETAWHNLFARNMFIQPAAEDLAEFNPAFTVLQAPSLTADPETDGTHSPTFIVVSLEQRLVLIGGTAYAGEIKKSIFSVMNFLLPPKGVLPMHCSANVGRDGDAAIFFGLSGTGKTTLSSDPARRLIGDDEHGWGPDGVFNFEGGCYAKTINLSAEAEPDIHRLCHTFGTIVENVMMRGDRSFDFDDSTLTENGRASYTLDAIPNREPSGRAAEPRTIVMLTCDAFGVLPPISRLSPEQAMYHFLSGYTAKVAGTERGLKEPAATFSTCFGAPFMPRHPTVYAELLGAAMTRTGAACWLVNTGWSGGGYGQGTRMPIKHTRAMLNAALDGRLAGVEERVDPNFGVFVPTACPDVPAEVLDPRATWADGEAYDAQARHLTRLFADNFKQFETAVDPQVMAAAIKAAA
jgi:phosphoenolpyruvate carboxykinase (ATP)